MIYIFYISFFLKYNTVDEKVKKGMISVETIFPREENAEHIFKKILENNDACERLSNPPASARCTLSSVGRATDS